MTFIKHLFVFIQSNLKTLQRKWLSFPLLLLFPVLLIGLVVTIAVSIIAPSVDDEPLRVGVVDLDQSDETQMVTSLIEQSSQLGDFIEIDAMTEAEADEKLDGELSAYISFPTGFTDSLYMGDAVTLDVTGNPDKKTDSYLIKELLDSIARHIRTAQANILTVDYYAQQLNITSETREDLLFEQFKDFFVYTLGKDKLVDEEQISNNATSSPVAYYGLAAWFMLLTIWMLVFYAFFTNDEQARMQERMRLYGVTLLQQLTAKIITTCILAMTLAGISLSVYVSAMDITLIWEDYGRLVLLSGLFSLIDLMILAILETLVTEQRLQLLAQSLFTFIVLLASGAIIPVLYFPDYIQNLLPYFFASESYRWLQAILLDSRLYADFLPLTLMLGAAAAVLIGVSVWKERARP